MSQVPFSTHRFQGIQKEAIKKDRVKNDTESQ